MSAFEQVTAMFGDSARWKLASYDYQILPLCNGPVKKTKQLWPLEDESLRKSPREPGSRLDLALEYSARILDSRPETALGVVVIGDGECTGKDIRPIVSKLAANNRIRAVLFVGLSPQFRARREQEFSPFGQRFVSAGWADAPQAISDFKKLMLSEQGKREGK